VGIEGRITAIGRIQTDEVAKELGIVLALASRLDDLAVVLEDSPAWGDAESDMDIEAAHQAVGVASLRTSSYIAWIPSCTT
jgi:hypothetical protein